MLTHLPLNTIKKLSESVTLKANNQGFEFIIINHPNFDAAFALQGAHLLHFQVKQQPPLIYLSETAIYDDNKAIRGGVPICWPWFAAPSKHLDENLPFHGFARTNKWRHTKLNETPQGIELEFEFASNEATKAIWDNDFSLTLNVSLSDHIELSLTTNNTGSNDFTYRGALHTYLNIADIHDCSIEGLPSNYFNSLKKEKASSEDKVLVTNKALDSIYDRNTENITVNDGSNQRKIIIENTGHDSVVVWNPWKDRKPPFIDMKVQDYQTMLCIESAITSEDGTLIKAGHAHTLKTSIY